MTHPIARIAAISMLFASMTGCTGDDLERAQIDTDSDLLDVVGILIQPEQLILPLGREQRLTARALLGDRQSQDLTDTVTWSVEGSAVSVSEDLDREGLLRAETVGKSKVTASYGGVTSPPVTVTVTDAALDRLSISPGRADIAKGDTAQLRATGTFTDGAQGDLTGQVRWITGDPSIVRFSDDGLIEGVNIGEAQVTASFEGTESDGIKVTVTQSPAPDLVISAATGEVSGGVMDLKVTVKNIGTTSANEFFVDLFLDMKEVPEGETVGYDFHYIEHLAPEGTATVEFQAPVVGVDTDVLVVVDVENYIDEVEESNNTLLATLSDGPPTLDGPNLVISFFDFIADPDLVYWEFDVDNIGDEDAGFFYVDLFIDQTWTPGIFDEGDEYTSIDGLPAGEWETVDFLVATTCDPCISWVLVDSLDDVVESNEDDNVEGPLTVEE